jgi:hypothetical protein
LEIEEDYMMSRVVGILTVIIGVFLFFAEHSLGIPDTLKTEVVKQTQNVEPPPTSEVAPKISSNEPLYDFGEVRQGEKVEHVFKIQNIGSADLEIKRASGS